MKAILLCAGRGSRLLPLTDTIPKCLVPVDGKAILDYQIENFRSAGISDFVIVGGYRIDKIAGHIEKYAKDVSIQLIHNPFWSVTSSIASLWMAKEHLSGAFCIANGDVITSESVIRHGLKDAQSGVNLLVEQAEPFLDDMRVALRAAKKSGRQIIAAVGKDLCSESAQYRSLGIIFCTDDHGSYRIMLEQLIAQDGGPQLYHHHILHSLAQTQEVTPLFAQGPWMEIDTPTDMSMWMEMTAVA